MPKKDRKKNSKSKQKQSKLTQVSETTAIERKEDAKETDIAETSELRSQTKPIEKESPGSDAEAKSDELTAEQRKQNEIIMHCFQEILNIAKDIAPGVRPSTSQYEAIYIHFEIIKKIWLTSSASTSVEDITLDPTPTEMNQKSNAIIRKHFDEALAVVDKLEPKSIATPDILLTLLKHLEAIKKACLTSVKNHNHALALSVEGTQTRILIQDFDKEGLYSLFDALKHGSDTSLLFINHGMKEIIDSAWVNKFLQRFAPEKIQTITWNGFYNQDNMICLQTAKQITNPKIANEYRDNLIKEGIEDVVLLESTFKYKDKLHPCFYLQIAYSKSLIQKVNLWKSKSAASFDEKQILQITDDPIITAGKKAISTVRSMFRTSTDLAKPSVFAITKDIADKAEVEVDRICALFSKTYNRIWKLADQLKMPKDLWFRDHITHCVACKIHGFADHTGLALFTAIELSKAGISPLDTYHLITKTEVTIQIILTYQGPVKLAQYFKELDNAIVIDPFLKICGYNYSDHDDLIKYHHIYKYQIGIDKQKPKIINGTVLDAKRIKVLEAGIENCLNMIEKLKIDVGQPRPSGQSIVPSATPSTSVTSQTREQFISMDEHEEATQKPGLS